MEIILKRKMTFGWKLLSTLIALTMVIGLIGGAFSVLAEPIVPCDDDCDYCEVCDECMDCGDCPGDCVEPCDDCDYCEVCDECADCGDCPGDCADVCEDCEDCRCPDCDNECVECEVCEECLFCGDCECEVVLISDDATLAALRITVGTVTTDFDLEEDADERAFTFEVARNVASVVITATATCEEATVGEIVAVGNANVNALVVGNNVFRITVTAEDGTVETYTITVNRMRSNDSTLSALRLSNGSLTPGFSANRRTYNVSVAPNVTRVTFTPTAACQFATFEIIGPSTLLVGRNEFVIRVTAEDGTYDIYTITVTRAGQGSGDGIMHGNTWWPGTTVNPPPVNNNDTDSEPDTTYPSTDVNRLFVDVTADDWFESYVITATTRGYFTGISDTEFAPYVATTRAMVVTILWRMSGSPAVEGTSQFYDVTEGTWYADALTWAAANGIVNGIGDNLFAPYRAITREQMAAIVHRYQRYANMVPPAIVSGITFEDWVIVSPSAHTYVTDLVNQGILNGRPGGIFDPRGAATRAEVAAMLIRWELAVN